IPACSLLRVTLGSRSIKNLSIRSNACFGSATIWWCSNNSSSCSSPGKSCIWQIYLTSSHAADSLSVAAYRSSPFQGKTGGSGNEARGPHSPDGDGQQMAQAKVQPAGGQRTTKGRATHLWRSLQQSYSGHSGCLP